MDKVQSNIIQHTYVYDSTYNIKFGKVLKQMVAHCFIYNRRTCFMPYNNCCCYCAVCKTYLFFVSKLITTKGQLMKMS